MPPLLPRSAFWTLAWLVVQAKALTVSTTRVPSAWAALITRVMRELVQPPQPVVSVPSRSRFLSAPLAVTPTEK